MITTGPPPTASAETLLQRIETMPISRPVDNLVGIGPVGLIGDLALATTTVPTTYTEIHTPATLVEPIGKTVEIKTRTSPRTARSLGEYCIDGVERKYPELKNRRKHRLLDNDALDEIADAVRTCDEKDRACLTNGDPLYYTRAWICQLSQNDKYLQARMRSPRPLYSFSPLLARDTRRYNPSLKRIWICQEITQEDQKEFAEKRYYGITGSDGCSFYNNDNLPREIYIRYCTQNPYNKRKPMDRAACRR